jgi:phenylacetate-CoA ligase
MNLKTLDFEKSSSEKIQKWQWEKVAESLQRAEKSPFYAKLFRLRKIDPKKIKNFSDFQKIPFTTEEDLRQSARDILALPLKKIWRVFATSGTTGKPKLIFREPIREDSEIVSVWHHLFERAGYFPKMAAVLRPTAGLGASGPVTEKVFEILGIPCFSVSPDVNFEKTLNAILQIQPDLLVISPSFASMLVFSAKEAGIDPRKLGIRAIISTGEPLHPNERNFLSREFQAEIFNTYGAADPSVWLASECQEHQGLHIFPYTAYWELLDEKFKANKNQGELILTPFSNHAMPLLRYRLGDQVTLDPAPCPCGCQLPRVVSVARKEKPIAIKLGQDQIDFEARKFLGNLVRSFPEISSFFNLIYDKNSGQKKLLFEIYDFNLPSARKEKIANEIEKIYFENFSDLHEIDTQALKKYLYLQIELVPLGSLKREAAKIKDQIMEK